MGTGHGLGDFEGAERIAPGAARPAAFASKAGDEVFDRMEGGVGDLGGEDFGVAEFR